MKAQFERLLCAAGIGCGDSPSRAEKSGNRGGFRRGRYRCFRQLAMERDFGGTIVQRNGDSNEDASRTNVIGGEADCDRTTGPR